MLQEIFWEKGIIGRIGGVEFAILANGKEKTVDGLVADLDRAASTFENSDGWSCPVSLSLGALSAGHMRRVPRRADRPGE